jgi:methyl-accepting chemotaxis protein
MEFGSFLREKPAGWHGAMRGAVMKIVTRLVILSAIPVIIIGFLGGQQVFQEVKNYFLAKAMLNNSRAFRGASLCIGDLQRERGTTSIAIGKKEVWSKVPDLRNETDKNCAKMRNAMQGTMLDEQLKRKIVDSMDAVSTLRHDAESAAVIGEVFSRYTEIIASIQRIQTSAANAPTTKGMGKAFLSLAILEVAKENMGQLRGFLSGLLAANRALTRSELQKVLSNKASIDSNLGSPALVLSPAVKEKIADLMKNESAKLVDEMVTTVLVKSNEGNFGISGPEFFELMSKRMTVLSDVVSSEAGGLEESVVKIQRDALVALWTAAITIFVVVILCGAIALAIGRSIQFSVRGASSFVASIADGDFSIRANAKGNDELSHLMRKMNDMASVLEQVVKKMVEIGRGNLTIDVPRLSTVDQLGAALSEMVKEMREMIVSARVVSEQVACGTKELEHGAKMLADGTVRQVEATEEISRSADMMRQKTEENTKQLENASASISEASKSAELGAGKVSAVVLSMEEISKSTNEISRIISTIDAIAFQTNLLALNASIEAARAGKAGKGFGVVADEVRQLASKSAEAATSTADLIERSLKEVTQGVGKVREMAEAFQNIRDRVDAGTLLMKDILDTYSDQTNTIREFSNGISQVSAVTMQNSAGAEQSAAAVKEISKQVNDLTQALESFKV